MGFNCNWNCNNCNQISVKIEIEPGQRKRRRDNHSNRLEQLDTTHADNMRIVGLGSIRKNTRREVRDEHLNRNWLPVIVILIRDEDWRPCSLAIKSNPLYSGWGSSKGLEQRESRQSEISGHQDTTDDDSNRILEAGLHAMQCNPMQSFNLDSCTLC